MSPGTVGKLFAYGQRSFPILVGEGDTDTVLVAGELGEGRIITVASDAYLNDVMRKLQASKIREHLAAKANWTESATQPSHPWHFLRGLRDRGE